MPGRLLPLVNDEIYHTFNRGIDRRPTFTDKREYGRALQTLNFYRFGSLPQRLSEYLILSGEKKEDVLAKLVRNGNTLVAIMSFCLMPNHFHFLLKQTSKGGISKFMSQFQNSYTRYFNKRHERIGPLFLDQFKAVRIETDEQFLHVSRYIHLNPYSSLVIKDKQDLLNYQWSSYPEFLGGRKVEICQKDEIISLFKKREDYKKFVLDQADYQKRLKEIEHLVFDD